MTNFLNTTTLSFGTHTASASVSYQKGTHGAYTAHFLLNFKETNATLEELLGLAGENTWADKINGSLGAEEFKPMLEFIVHALGSAISLAKIEIANEQVSIGSVVAIPCSSVNVTCEKRETNETRWVIQGFTGTPRKESFYLDFTHKESAEESTEGSSLKALSFECDATLLGVNTQFTAFYNLTEDWELQFRTKKGEIIPLSELVEKFLAHVSIPAKMPNLKLSDVTMTWKG